MEDNQNPSKIWNDIWEDYNVQDQRFLQEELNKAKQSVTWKRYTQIVKTKFGGWKNIVSIEIGSGMGGHSLMAASEGATVYLLDYSETALDNAKKRFELLNLKGYFLMGNAFDIDKYNKNKFNLSWSFGTAEHFKGQIRQDFFELHFNYLTENGITIISCPYKYALNYRIWMYYAEKYNDWKYGLEIPYSKSEFLKRLKVSRNKLIEVYFDEGRPCLAKAIRILKKNSQIRYLIIGSILRVFLKLKIKIPPFYYRSVILIAEKSKNHNF